MTVQEKPYPVVSRVVDIFGEWLKHRRELREMREMDAANFGQIASELRMSSADLEALVRRGPHAADELPKMLAALGIDQDDLARTEPLVLRDMERVCCAVQPQAPVRPRSRRRHRRCALRRVLRQCRHDRWPRPAGRFIALPLPSPLVGEGGSLTRSGGEPDEGSVSADGRPLIRRFAPSSPTRGEGKKRRAKI